MLFTEAPVYSIGLFGDNIQHFWMGELGGLLEKFPSLEFPHKQDFYVLILVEEADGEIQIDNYRIKLDDPKAIVIKPRCINNISLNRKAHGTVICFTEDFFFFALQQQHPASIYIFAERGHTLYSHEGRPKSKVEFVAKVACGRV